jgi:hypothetical protein
MSALLSEHAVAEHDTLIDEDRWKSGAGHQPPCPLLRQHDHGPLIQATYLRPMVYWAVVLIACLICKPWLAGMRLFASR